MQEPIPKSLINAFITFILILLLGAVSYDYYAAHMARKYLANLHTNTVKLQSNLSKLANTADSPVFADPQSFAASTKNLKQIEEGINQARTELSSYQQSLGSLPELKLANSFGEYKKAKVKQRLAADIVNQTHDVLSNYQTTTEYFLALNDTQALFETSTNRINSVSILSGLNAVQVASDAKALQVATDKFSRQPTTERLQTSKDAMLKVLNQTIVGYKAVVVGLQSGSEAGLDSAIKIIEQQTNLYDASVKNQAVGALQNSATLTDVIDLPTKPALLISIKD